MSYQIKFMGTRMIDDRWGYDLYFNVGLSSYQPVALLDLQPVSRTLVCNRQDQFNATSPTFNAFIEESGEGLKVNYDLSEISEIELNVRTPSNVVTLEDTVEFYSRYYASIQTASHRLTSLMHSVQSDEEVLVDWNIWSRDEILIAPRRVNLNCLESFVKQLDLSGIQPIAAGTYTIAELIGMGAVAEYCTFSTIQVAPRL